MKKTKSLWHALFEISTYVNIESYVQIDEQLIETEIQAELMQDLEERE